MRTYADSVVNKFATETTGNAGAGALVTVYVSGSTVKAPLFDVLSVAITNPLAADDEGNYSFKVADGIYDLIINKGALSETRIDRLQIAEIVGFNDDNGNYLDLASAQAANLSISTVVTTAGYYEANDGGGSSYNVVAAGTGPADGGSYLDMLNGNQLELIIPSRLNARAYGLRGDNTIADNIQIFNLLTLGIPVFFPAGNYRLANTGLDSEAVILNSHNKNIDVICDSNCKFIADQVDGDMIRFEVPFDGAGITSLLTWSWVGGVFDQRDQKNSLITPYSGDYPPVNLGTSATADGLYLSCSYNDGSIKSGVGKVTLKGITTIGSYDHWTLAGGDSGLFCVGAEIMDVSECISIGNRDAGIYLSDTDGVHVVKKIDAYKNRSFWSVDGVTVKRSSTNTSIDRNYAENTLLPFSILFVSGSGANNISITNNICSNAWKGIRVDFASSVICSGNIITDLGQTMPGNLPDTNLFTSGTGIFLEGVKGSTCINNTIKDINTLYTDPNFGDGFILGLYDDGGQNETSENNNISNNIISGIHDGGNDSGGVGASNNFFQFNTIFDCTLNRFILVDPDTIAVKLGDGSLMTIGDGDDRTKASFTSIGGLSLDNAVFIKGKNIIGSRRTGWAAPTGAQSKLAFDPATVTTEELAKRLAALIDDLSEITGGHGLIGA